ncbi:MAG TPA: class I SAM-dependent methyltransferase [Actinoallomurus sp.]
MATELKELFGHLAGYAAVVGFVVVVTLVVWLARKGVLRKAGPFEFRAPDGNAARAESTRDEDCGGSDLRPAGVVRLYDVGNAKQFYTEIAPNYDLNNSANLLATHMEVIERIKQARAPKRRLQVLDLGSGTGERVATFFLNDPRVRWTAIDFCQAMVGRFQQHLAGRPLDQRPSVYNEDLNNVHHLLPRGAYDVVLLNLVLSSMPELPDFRQISKLVAPGGRLIISDINPSYARTHPHYKATTADSDLVALRIHPVEPLEVATRAKEAGLHLSEMGRIGSADTSYSFIVVFANTVRPGKGYDSPDTRTRPA